jgi:hypothetical protein
MQFCGYGSGMNILDNFRELRTVFTKLFDANPGSEIFDPGSEIQDGKIWIRDKHPGSGTMVGWVSL